MPKAEEAIIVTCCQSLPRGGYLSDKICFIKCGQYLIAHPVGYRPTRQLIDKILPEREPIIGGIEKELFDFLGLSDLYMFLEEPPINACACFGWPLRCHDKRS
jgi:hypothetical protein